MSGVFATLLKRFIGVPYKNTNQPFFYWGPQNISQPFYQSHALINQLHVHTFHTVMLINNQSNKKFKIEKKKKTIFSSDRLLDLMTKITSLSQWAIVWQVQHFLNI